MGIYSITKTFSFEYSHKLNMDYESACKNLHGHSAKIIVQIWSKELNKSGMIVDFMHLSVFKKYLDINLDHSIILNGKDNFVEFIQNNNMKSFILENDMEPTSEIMSKVLWDKFAFILNDLAINWDSMEVTFYETANNCASYKDSYNPV